MPQHVAEFFARPLAADRDRGIPAWVSEFSTLCIALWLAALLAGQAALGLAFIATFLVCMFFPHLFGHRRPGERHTSAYLLIAANVALAIGVLAVGLDLGLVDLPAWIALVVVVVTLVPLAHRWVRAVAALRPRSR